MVVLPLLVTQPFDRPTSNEQPKQTEDNNHCLQNTDVTFGSKASRPAAPEARLDEKCVRPAMPLSPGFIFAHHFLLISNFVLFSIHIGRMAV
jgi:hypothetical protein